MQTWEVIGYSIAENGEITQTVADVLKTGTQEECLQAVKNLVGSFGTMFSDTHGQAPSPSGYRVYSARPIKLYLKESVNMLTTIKDLFRLNRHSDTSVILQYAEIIFDNPILDSDYTLFNDFGGENPHSFLGIEQNL